MKTKLIISLILCIFFFQRVGMSQTGTSVKKAQVVKKRIQAELIELQKHSQATMVGQVLMLDSLLYKRGTGYTVPRVWSRSSDSYFSMLDNSSKSSLSFRKEFKEKKTFNRSYDMEFTKDHKTMGIRINAYASEGSVQIVIIKPNGKNFKVLEVEDIESLEWNHALNAYTEDNKKEYEGLWKVKVVVKNAIGHYSIRLIMK